MAKIENSVHVSAVIAPYDTLDSYAVTDEKYNKGGYRSVENETERLNIPAERRSLGMIVRQLDTNRLWTLLQSIDNSSWEMLNIGNLSNINASSVIYNNIISQILSTNTQGAIDEIDTRVDSLEDTIVNKANISDVVNLTTNQFIDGLKTFYKSVTINGNINITGLVDNVDISELKAIVDSLKTGIQFKGEFPTYADMIAYFDGSTPEQTLKDGYWIIIVHDENHNGSKTQYVYNASSTQFIFAGEVSTINDASSSVKGILKLSGDLSGTADTPQLISTGVTEGIYNISGGSVTIDKKGRILNISVSSVREWEISSLANTRNTDVTTFTVPEYNLTSSVIKVYWNGNLLIIGRDYEKTNITTITFKFNIRIVDDIYIVSEKNIGLFDIGDIINDNVSSTVTAYSSDKLENNFAKLNRSFNFNMDNTYDLGSTAYRIKDIYLANNPIVSSDKRYKLDIEKNDLGLDFILKLNPKKYKMKENGRTHRGFLAQDLKSILKEHNAMYVQDAETGIMGNKTVTTNLNKTIQICIKI